MPFITEKISSRIKSSESFYDLMKVLESVSNWEYYYNIILEKLQTLPLEGFSDIIWALLTRNMSAWRPVLQVLCDRIITDGLMDSDKSWNEPIDVIPVIVVLSSVDRTRIDKSCLRITLSAMLGYDDDFAYDVFTDDRVQKIFAPSQDTLDMTSSADLVFINTLFNEDAKTEFLYNLIQDKNDSSKKGLIRIKCVEITLHIIEVVGNDSEVDEDIVSDWLTYLIVTLEEIYTKYTNTWSNTQIQKKIVIEWGNSLEILMSQLPWNAPTNAAVTKILKTAAFDWMYKIYNSENGSQQWVDSLDNLLTAVRINDVGYPIEIDPKFQSVLEASYKNYSYQDSDENDDQEDDDYSRDDSDDEDESDEDTAEDRAARRKDTFGKDRRKKMGRTQKYDSDTTMTDRAARKIYSGYRVYRDNVEKVDGQITKIVENLKDRKRRGIRDQIVEGKRFSLIRILKTIMSTSAVFSYNKVAGVLFVIVRHFRGKNATNKERISMLEELQLEIKMLDEKIDDARGDGNRQAKYAMMRTRAELQKSYDQIKYGLTAGEKAKRTAKDLIRHKLDLGRER